MSRFLFLIFFLNTIASVSMPFLPVLISIIHYYFSFCYSFSFLNFIIISSNSHESSLLYSFPLLFISYPLPFLSSFIPLYVLSFHSLRSFLFISLSFLLFRCFFSLFPSLTLLLHLNLFLHYSFHSHFPLHSSSFLSLFCSFRPNVAQQRPNKHLSTTDPS
jgi:hypothetical protein